MNTNVNLEAPVGALAFLALAFCLFVAGIIILHALKTKRRGRAHIVFFSAIGLLGIYIWAVVAFSLASSQKVLARGEEKYFCELDCHLAYSVLNVRTAKTLGEAGKQATARGLFYVVTVRTRFDEQTIAPRRGNQPLHPNPRALHVFDEAGNEYGLSAEGQRALESSQGIGTPLSTPLRPGEFYTTELVFDLPADVRNPRLLINEDGVVTHFIIGHENSLLHKKTEFQI